VQYIGVDIIEISRIVDSVSSLGDAFLERIYTPKEIEAYRDKIPSLAARFAAKEAAIKALGAAGLSLREIEVLSAFDGKPVITLHGKAWQRAEELNIAGLEISLSHSKEYAVAFVVGMSK